MRTRVTNFVAETETTTMKKLLTIFLLLTCGICSGQNLVPNGDFELFSSCPTSYSQLFRTNFWIQPTSGTPDYFNQCANPFSFMPVSVPNTFYGFQQAHSGVAFAGLYINNLEGLPNYREYIEVPLVSSLNANVCYHFEMYINLGNACAYTAYNIGVYFSDTLMTDSITTLNLPLTPQINNIPGNAPDSLNWTLVSGNYTAVGGESYLTIGNFNNDLNTDTIKVNFNPSHNNTYIYVDDVLLTTCSTQNIKEQTEQLITLYPNPITDKLKVEVNNNEPTEIILYDLSLRKLLQQTFTNTTTLNTEQLAKGMYLYTVRNRNGIIKNGKVIKQ